MDLVYIRIIETAVVVLSYLIVKHLIFKLVNRTLSTKLIQESRGTVIQKIINLVLIILCALFISLIWGVNQSDLAVFIGSVLTVVGVAFFAQWSLLSNVTASIIIFFNHPLKLNDTIIILEGKDYGIEGRVRNIGLFFVTLETEESGEITLPNNVFILKSIKNITDSDRSVQKEGDSSES